MVIETTRDFWLFLHWFGLGLAVLTILGMALEFFLLDPEERTCD